MRIQTFVTLVIVGFIALGASMVSAQAPAQGRGNAAPAGRGAAAGQQQLHGNLLQVMRGIFFPNSNVIFAAQTQNPNDVPKDKDPSQSVNPLAGMYGGWLAIENSGIALAEASNLLTIPGRMCSNGKPAPVQAADWQMFVRGMRDAGMEVYKAGMSKNQDTVIEAADTLATACSNCHDVYREKSPAQGGMAARCTK